VKQWAAPGGQPFLYTKGEGERERERHERHERHEREREIHENNEISEIYGRKRLVEDGEGKKQNKL